MSSANRLSAAEPGSHEASSTSRSRSDAPASTSESLPPHLRYDRRAVETYLSSYPLARLIRTRLHHGERLPSGPALLVGNHGPLALDTGLLIQAIFRENGRVVRCLGDRILFTNPIGRQMARSVAGVEGSPDNAHALLTHGEQVLVYPGGARETVRAANERYRLDWEGRLGFARTALRAGVPIVPVACIGSDDLFTQLVDSETMRNSLPGRVASLFLKPDYIPPLYFPKLRSTQFHYFFGEPIALTPGASAQDEAAVTELRDRTKDALEAMCEHGRAVRRAAIDGSER
ncbi:MAG: lysophospholipid acyltransferase family protein [Myxococcales bacterium]